MPRVRKLEINDRCKDNHKRRNDDNSKNAIINVSVMWGTRRLQLDARFGGVVFLGVALIVLVAVLVVRGQRWPNL
jgi:hypothetical protein